MVSKYFQIKIDKFGYIGCNDPHYIIRDGYAAIKKVKKITDREIFSRGLQLIQIYDPEMNGIETEEKKERNKQDQMQIQNMRANGYRHFGYSYANAVKYTIRMLGTDAMNIKTVKRNMLKMIPNEGLDPDHDPNWKKFGKTPMTKLQIIKDKIHFLKTKPPFLDMKRITEYSFDTIHQVHSEWSGYAVGDRKPLENVKKFIDMGFKK